MASHAKPKSTANHPRRNYPRSSTPTGGSPTRPSNKGVVATSPDPERYAGGIRVFASAVDDWRLRHLCKQAEDAAYVRELCKQAEDSSLRVAARQQARRLFKAAGDEREPVADAHASAPVQVMRPRSEIVLFASDGVYAIDKGDYILFPGGGVDDGEQARDSAIRETLEEAGRQALNVEAAGVVESVWPKDSGNAFWDDSDFDGERTYFFVALDGGDSGGQHPDREAFKVIGFDDLVERLDALIADPGQAWAKRNNEERVALVKRAKRLVRTKDGTSPHKQASVVEQVGIQKDPADKFVEQLKGGRAPPPAGGAPPPAAAAPAPMDPPGGGIRGPETPAADALHGQNKQADAARFLPRKQIVMVDPEGRVAARRVGSRRYSFPEDGDGKPALYEDPVRFTPPTGVPEEGYHGYEIQFHTRDLDGDPPEGFDLIPAQEMLSDMYGGMGLAVNKPYRHVDRAKARVLTRLLRKRLQSRL
jgi:8-oxo-dGTP pyrophosphatase MutT (NUDIX family)